MNAEAKLFQLLLVALRNEGMAGSYWDAKSWSLSTLCMQVTFLHPSFELLSSVIPKIFWKNRSESIQKVKTHLVHFPFSWVKSPMTWRQSWSLTGCHSLNVAKASLGGVHKILLQYLAFFDHLPPFSCKHSLWATPITMKDVSTGQRK